MADLRLRLARLAERALHRAHGCVEPSPTGLSRMIQPLIIRIAGEAEAQLSLPALIQPFEEMLAAEGDVAVVPANLGLLTADDGVAFLVDPEVHRRLAAAFADGFQFDQRVGQREQRRRPGKQLALEIGSQAIAEHRNIQLVGDLAELQHMRLRQELRLVDEDAVQRCASAVRC